MKYYNQKSWVYFNDTFKKVNETGVDLFNQSLHYGFAAIEGIRAYKTHNGPRIFKGPAHLQRLKATCIKIGLAFPWDTDELLRICYLLLEKNNLSSAYIRPMVIARHNMFLTPSPETDLVIALWEWGPFLGAGNLNMLVSDYQKASPQQVPPDTKASGNYLASILATTDARAKGFDEAILTNAEGMVCQASSNNIFIEKHDTLITPPTGQIFPGITRGTVIDIAKRLQYKVDERPITVEDLMDADSAFLTGTATGIVGINAINNKKLPQSWADSIGSNIQYAYKNLTHETENFEVII